MAKRARRHSYRAAVDGSLAYDLSNPALHPEDIAGQLKSPAVPKIREKPQARAIPRTKQFVAPGAILGFSIAAILMVMMLMAQVRLTILSDETVALQNTLMELRTEESKLKIAYEGAFNLSEIETYATKELGMQKPRSDQIFYVNSSAPDKAMILREEAEQKDTLFTKLEEFFVSLGEYFK